MKKFIAIIVSIFFLSTSASVVYAEDGYCGYSRILTADTGFYSDMNGSYLKFYLPYGYYVKVLEVGSAYTKVSYMNETSQFPFLTGYVRTVDLITTDKIPVSPYPLLSITVISDDVLFSDSMLTYSKVGVYANSLAVYYGEIKNANDEELVYVYCNGYLGYMRKTAFAPFVVPSHPDPIQTSYRDSEKVSVVKQKNSSMQILVVAGISITVVAIVYFLFRPSDKKRIEREDEEDYIR